MSFRWQSNLRLPRLLATLALATGCGHSHQNLRTSAVYYETPPACVAVAPFENLSLTSQAGLIVAELAAHEMNIQMRSIAMGPNEVIAQAVKRNVDVASLTQPSTLGTLSAEWGLDAVLTGSVNEFWYTDDPEVYKDKQPSVSVRMHLIDARSGETLWEGESARTPSGMRPGIALLSATAAEVVHDFFAELERRAGTLQADKRTTLCPFESPAFVAAIVPPTRGMKAARQTAPRPAPVEQAAVAVPPPAPTPVTAPGAGTAVPAAPVVAQASEPSVPLSTDAEEIVALLKRNEPSILPGVRFEQSNTLLVDGSQRALDLLGEALRHYPDMKIEITVHSDNTDEATAAMDLTARQAAMLRGYLQQKFGIDERAVAIDGRGGDAPLLPNINRRNRMLNRRVEIRTIRPPSNW